MNATIFAVDHAGLTHPLRYFLDYGGQKIIFVHQGDRILRTFIELNGSLDGFFFVFSYAWHLDDHRALQLRAGYEELFAAFPREKSHILNNTIHVANSSGETARLRYFLPEFRVVRANNCCFLNEALFSIKSRDFIYPAVMNARPVALKRHYLLRETHDALLISYDEEAAKREPDYVDLRSIPHRALIFDVSYDQVTDLLNQCCCGLALSESEGACYASAEYLLSGIPVVSTVSLGGRDEFYSPGSSLIVPPDPPQVASAVRALDAAMRAGKIDRADIRRHVLEIIRRFRVELSRELAAATGLPFDAVVELLTARIAESNKLWNFRNFWTQNLLPN